jgi:two-component system, NarL family, response regulator DevR
VSEAAAHTRVALVDDHDVVGVALESALAGSPHLRFVGGAATVTELIAARLGAEIVVLDLRLADGSSPVDNAVALLATGASVVAYTSGESPYLIRLVSRTAISGVVRKTAPIAELTDTLERCAAGELIFSTEWAAAIASDDGLDAAALSPRETEVLELVAAGLPTKAVASRLGIAIPTLEVHLRRLRDKYARIGRPAETRSELVFRALEDGHAPLPGDTA